VASEPSSALQRLATSRAAIRSVIGRQGRGGIWTVLVSVTVVRPALSGRRFHRFDADIVLGTPEMS